MTTIAAKKTKSGKVSVAWDGQVTSGNVASSRGMNKVVAVNNQFLVGGAGHLRYLNLIQRASVDRIHLEDLSDPDFDAEGWAISELVPAWAQSIGDAWSKTPHDSDDEVPWGRAIVVVAGNILDIGSDFSVSSADEFTAIGSGAPFATAAMHLGKSAANAVVVASELDLYTGGTIKETKV